MTRQKLTHFNLMKILMTTLAILTFCVVPLLAQPVQQVVSQYDPPTNGEQLGIKSQGRSADSTSANGITMPGSPLDIVVYDDGSLSLREAGKNHFYGSRASGFFMWIGDAVYGPSVPAGASHYAFTNIEHTGPIGGGTSADPWRIVSKFQAGNPEITVEQTVSYVNGARHIDFTWRIVNSGGNNNSITLFHAADLYVDGNDYGIGYLDSRNRAVGGYNVDSGIYGIFTPITPPDAYEENFYGTIWNRIGGTGRGSGFQNSIRTDYIDNGAGLQWNLRQIAPSSSIAVRSRFSVTPQNTSEPGLESPPTPFQVVTNRLPLLREFEFGVQVAGSPEDYRVGPFDFVIPISRYYGSYIADRAQLTVRVFDIDTPNERYTLKINNRSDCNISGDLRGNNGGWTTTTFTFNSNCLHFPNLSLNRRDYTNLDLPSDVTLSPANNTFRLESTTNANAYQALIAWALLNVGGTRPILFGHGIDALTLSCDNNTREIGNWENWIYNRGLPGLGARANGSQHLITQINSWLYTYQWEMVPLLGLRTSRTSGVKEPDRIIIVGHSMGGLIGRGLTNTEHSRDNFVVEDLVGYGTPNSGSSLLSPVNGIPTCSSPARSSIVPDAIRVWNQDNNLQSAWSAWRSNYGGVTGAIDHVTMVAAQYRNLLNIIMRGDDVVMVSNVHSLNYSNDLTYTWPDDANNGEQLPSQILHQAIPRLQSVFDLIADASGIGQIVDSRARNRQRNQEVLTDLRARTAREAEPRRYLTAPRVVDEGTPEEQIITLFSGNIEAGESVEFAVSVDEPGILLLLPIPYANNGDMSVTITSPDGTEYVAEGSSLIVEEPNVGVWQVTINGTPDGGTYNLQLSTESSTLALDPLPGQDGQQHVTQGNQVLLGAEVKDGGISLANLTAAATIELPDGRTQQVSTNDAGQDGDVTAGDGIYSAAFPTDQTTPTGPYLVTYSVNGNRTDGRPFQRLIIAGFTVLEGVGLSEDVVQWTAEDVDSDGLADIVRGKVTVVPPAAGTYDVIASLRDNYSGSIIGQSTVQTIVSADQIGVAQLVALEFGGNYLGSLQADLDLSLTNISLYYRGGATTARSIVNDGDSALLDYESELGGNLTLGAASLEGPLLLAAVDGHSLPDDDGDGFANALRFNIALYSRFGGSYTLQATLQDNTGQSFAFIEQGLQLGSGIQDISVDFDAIQIVQNGVEGPFTLGNVSLLPTNPENLQTEYLELADLYTTESLSLNVFEEVVSLIIVSNMDENRAYVRVSPANPNNLYPTGTEVTLEPVIVDPLVVFESWTVNGETRSESPLVISLDTATTVEAFFRGPEVAVSAEPPVIPTGSFNTSLITAVLTDAVGLPWPDQTIEFTTTLGTLSNLTATTDVNGVATTTLTAAMTIGVANVTATAGSASDNTTVDFVAGPPASVMLAAHPITITANVSSTSIVTATVKDAFNNLVSSHAVTFTTSLGSVTGPAITDASGVATATLTAATTTGTAVITATAGSASGNTSVVLVAGPPASVLLTASPGQIIANGVSTSIITATVKDAFANLVTSHAVTFTTSLGTVVGSATTDASGVATTTLTAAMTTGTAVITATAGSASGNTSVVLVAGPPASVLLTASPSQIIANGISTSIITATVKDVFANLVPSYAVTFTTSAGSVTGAGMTNTNGVATAMLTATTTTGTAVITATAGSASGNTSVVLVAGPPASVLLTTSPTQIIANGVSTSIITATVKDTFANLVPSHAVTFTTSLGSVVGSATTNASGIATRTLTAATTTGTALITATAGSASGNTSVVLVAGPPASVLLTASPAQIIANGVSTSIITATVKDAFANLVPGHAITFTTSLGSVTGSATTNASGVATATLTAATTTGTAVITATAGSVSGNTSVAFVAGPPASVLVTASPGQIVADGVSTSIITATVKDAFANLVPSHAVTFITSLGTVTGSATTNASGVATGTLTSATTTGTATVTATAGTANGNAAVTFVAGPPASVSVAVSPSQIVANGASTSVVTATVKDAFANLVPSHAVTFTTSLGTVTGSATTNASGVATGTLTSATTVGTATVTATAGMANGNATVVFVTGPISSLLVVVSPSSIPADGVSTSMITVTVKDGNGNPIPSVQMNLATTAGAITNPVTTNANGIATATLTAGRSAATATVTATATVGAVSNTATVTFTAVTYRTYLPMTAK